MTLILYCVTFGVTERSFHTPSACIISTKPVQFSFRCYVEVKNHPPIVVDGCLPFVRMNRLGSPFNNGKDFFKTSQPAKRDGACHLHSG